MSSGPAIHQVENHIAVVETWKLLPCFFNQLPPDVTEYLPPLTNTMSRVLEDKRFPELIHVLCQSISSLSRSANDHLEMYHTSLQSTSRVLLPLLFKISISALQEGVPESYTMETERDNSHGGDCPELGQKLQILGDAVCSLSKMADESFLQGLFKKLMHRLLEEMQLSSPSEGKLSTYFLLSQSLVRSGTLNEGNIDFLFRATKPLLYDGEHSTRTLRRAYKLLAEICEKYSSFFSRPQHLEEISSLLKDTAGTCQVAARYMRLKCVSRVVEGLDNPTSTLSATTLAKILSMTSEILICLKDSNRKTREAAFELLLAIAAKSEYNTLLRILTASLAAETPHMRSSAVMALSRVVYELVNDREEVQTSLPALLSTVLCLFAEDSREVIKSVVGFTRMCVSVISDEQLQPLLPELVGGLMKYNKVKERFRPKIKIILKKLVKRFGYDGLMPFVPKSEVRLLTHMRKVEERSNRKKQLASGSASETATKVAAFDTFLDSDEEDSDNGRTLVTTIAGEALSRASGRKTTRTGTTVGSKRSRGGVETKVQLPAERDGNIVDMLGSNISKRVTFLDVDGADDQSSSEDDIVFNDDGMLVVQEQEIADKEEEHIGKKRRITKLESVQLSQKQKQGTKKKTTPEQLGRAYKSNKAGGDVKRKDHKYEPYAFVPLNAKAYSKKNRRSAVASMSTVVRQGTKTQK
jgi:ribosomal RNA-processing protein 12